MDDFLSKFFPQVVRAKKVNNNYCHYDNQGLSAFTSSLYLAGMVSAVFAQYSTRQLGRTKTMLIAGSSVLIGAILNVSGVNLAMLIIGRIMLGLGIGAGNQVQYN
jgi:MFS family permease